MRVNVDLSQNSLMCWSPVRVPWSPRNAENIHFLGKIIKGKYIGKTRVSASRKKNVVVLEKGPRLLKQSCLFLQRDASNELLPEISPNV